jgi:cobalt-zinc-cadmium efflux system protein
LRAHLEHPLDHSHHHLDAGRAENRRRLVWALEVNILLTAVELIGGLLTGSLAVLADAGHLLSDVGAIAMAVLAARLGARTATSRQTFGYRRGEVLAALGNGVLLVAIAVTVTVAAITRFSDPPGIDGAGVLALGAIGLAGNAFATVILARGDRSDLNLEAVVRHSAADAIGALAVVACGAFVLAGGSSVVDPLAGIAIAVLIAASSVKVIREPVRVLMESAPAGLDVDQVAQSICQVGSVTSVHDLHVWTVTPGFEALAAHVVVGTASDRDQARRELEYMLREQFGIEHTTLQMEEEGDRALLQIDLEPPRAP